MQELNIRERNEERGQVMEGQAPRAVCQEFSRVQFLQERSGQACPTDTEKAAEPKDSPTLLTERTSCQKEEESA